MSDRERAAEGVGNIDLDKREAVAKAATPGRWAFGDRTGSLRVETAGGNQTTEICVLEEQGDAEERGLWGTEFKNADHIATFDPPTVLALIERLRKAETEVHYANGVAELAMKHRDAAEADVASLRALLCEASDALRPFVDEAFVWHNLIPDRRTIKIYTGAAAEDASFTVGDLRAARTVATEIKEALK